MTLKKHAALFGITLALFLGFSYFRFREVKNTGLTGGFTIQTKKSEPQVLSDTSDDKNSDEPEPTTPKAKVEATETQIPPTNTPQPVQQSITITNDVETGNNDNGPKSPSINDFYYPGSSDNGSGSSSLNLSSSDHPNKITDWYRAKIESLNLNVNSFVKTSANDKTLNKLSAASSTFEVNVEISKNPGDTVTTISVVVE